MVSRLLHLECLVDRSRYHGMERQDQSPASLDGIGRVTNHAQVFWAQKVGH